MVTQKGERKKEVMLRVMIMIVMMSTMTMTSMVAKNYTELRTRVEVHFCEIFLLPLLLLFYLCQHKIYELIAAHMTRD
jgi:hypothetical protein